MGRTDQSGTLHPAGDSAEDHAVAPQASTGRAHLAALVGKRPELLAVPLGILAIALVSAFAGEGHAADVALSGPWLQAVLLAATVAGEFLSVQVRSQSRGGTQELTLFEAAAVADALLLPPRQAMLLPVIALMLAMVAMRRPLQRIAFAAGTAATACAVLVGSVAGIGHPQQGFHGGTVIIGLLVGTLGFVTVNLTGTAVLRAVLTGVPVEATLRQGLRLATVMAVGTLSLGATAVAMAESAPLLLPFSLLPALALTYAYAAVAEEGDERLRSQQLLALSHLMAGALDVEDLVTSFLALVREAFHAESALVVLESAGREETAVVADADGVLVRLAHPAERALLATAGVGTELIASAATAPGPARVLLAPLDAEGRRLGIVMLTEPVAVRRRLSVAAFTRTTERSCALGPAEATVVGPLASALAVALRGAEHLARLTEETDKLQQVVDGSSDGIVVLDSEGTVIVWSPAMASISGVTAETAVGRPLSTVVEVRGPAGEDSDVLGDAWRALSVEDPAMTIELALVRPDGEQRFVRWAHAAVFDANEDGGRLLRDVVLIHDVTRDREVERLKTDFIATVSHELRSPITPIKGYVALLRRKGEEFTPEKRLEILDLVGDRVAHLTRLVEDVLLASRVTSPASSVVMGPGDLAALTRKSLGDFAVEGARLNVEVAQDIVPVACDPVRVVQVVSNLISNALKYSGADSPVFVKTSWFQGTAFVEVRDQGRGIPADQLERVFEKFHRVEDPMRMTTGGTGLGLFIARQLAEAMGGTLSVASTYGVGSTFTFAMPVTQPGDIPTPILGAPAPRSGVWPPFPVIPVRSGG